MEREERAEREGSAEKRELVEVTEEVPLEPRLVER